MTSLYDIAVLGAGPAGANAALAAAQHGLSVVLLDEQTRPGGQIWRAKDSSIRAAPPTPETRAGDRLRTLVSGSAVTHMGNAHVWQIEKTEGVWHLFALIGRESLKVQARALVIASGAREFVQPVPGWTTPGVIGLAGATALLKQSLTLPGKKTVVAGTGPLVFFVASEIRRLGGTVAAVVTPNTRRDWLTVLPAMLSRPDLLARGGLWVADLMLDRIPIRWGHSVTTVTGGTQVTGVQVTSVDKTWAPTGTPTQIDADSLCLGNGLIPSIEAAQLAGCDIEHRADLGGWVPKVGDDAVTDVQGLFLCGDGSGIRGAAAAEIHGRLAGLSAATYLGKQTDAERAALRSSYTRAARFGMAMTRLSIPRTGLAALTLDDTIVCRCESLTCANVAGEIDRGAGSTNAVKSGLRAGMGPCGGKYCQVVVARMIANAQGQSDASVPPPTPRPPLRPVPVQALAGDFDYSDLPIPKPAPL